jgi:hypothetical protein
MHAPDESDAEPNAQIINPLGIGMRRSYSASWVSQRAAPCQVGLNG